MDYYLAPSLARLRREVDVRWPGRDRTSDGWIGDASHQARPSDHNPDWDSGGVVRAVDLDKDGMDGMAVVEAAIRHEATNYVIHNRLIWSRIRGFRPVDYDGVNAHYSHVHVSIRHTWDAETSTAPWLGLADAGSRIPDLPDLGDLSPEDQMALEDAITALTQAQAQTNLILERISGQLGSVPQNTADLIRKGLEGSTHAASGQHAAAQRDALLAAVRALEVGAPASVEGTYTITKES